MCPWQWIQSNMFSWIIYEFKKYILWNDLSLQLEKEDDLNATDDGEAIEESHGAANETQLGLPLVILVSLDIVNASSVKTNC